MNVYAGLMDIPEEERQLVRQSLLEYYKLDTLTMVNFGGNWSIYKELDLIKGEGT